MSPLNLEDIEGYLKKRAKDIFRDHQEKVIRAFLAGRFTELRAREASIVQNPMKE